MKITNILITAIAFLLIVLTIISLGTLNMSVRLFNVFIQQMVKTEQSQLGSVEVNFITGNSTNSSSTVATTSWTKISSADMGMTYRRIKNNSPATMFLIESTTTPTIATTTNNGAAAVGFMLNASGNANDIYISTPDHLYTGDIYAIASGTPGIVSTFIQKK